MTMPDYEITLKMSAGQARTVVAALDLYFRVLCGQFNEIAALFIEFEPMLDMISATGFAKHSRTAFRKKLDEARQEVFPGFSVSASIGVAEGDPRARRAYDVLQVVRHRLARDGGTPKSGFRPVDFDDPMKTGDEPLPKVSSHSSRVPK